MATKRRPPRSRDQLQQAALATVQVLFMVCVLVIFIVPFAIQSGAVQMPEWTKTWQTATPEARAGYAAALFSIVTILGVACVVCGYFLLRSGLY